MTTLGKLCLIVYTVLLYSNSYGQEPHNHETLPKNIPFTGILNDDKGAPIPDVKVHLQQSGVASSGRGYANSHIVSDTDEQGSFTLFLMKEGSGVIFANSPGKVVAHEVVSDPPLASVALTLKESGRTLEGTVIDADGNPVANALLIISANAHTTTTPDGIRNWHIGLREAGPLNVTADADGRFKVDDLPELPIVVWAAMPDDKEGLFENYRMSAKKPVLDLEDGDVRDYRAVIDPPYSPPSARIGQHQQSIKKVLQDAQRK